MAYMLLLLRTDVFVLYCVSRADLSVGLEGLAEASARGGGTTAISFLDSI